MRAKCNFTNIKKKPPTKSDAKCKEKIPNAETIAAIREAERGEVYGPFNDVESLFAALDSDDEE